MVREDTQVFTATHSEVLCAHTFGPETREKGSSITEAALRAYNIASI